MRIIRNPWTQVIFSALVLLSTYLVINPPDILFFKSVNAKAVYFMFALLGTVIGSLILDMKRVMFTSIAACGLMAVFLKVNSNSQLQAVNKTPKEITSDFLKVAHFNAQDLGTEADGTLKIIEDIDADVIFVQELTPQWDKVIQEKFSKKYPKHKCFVRIDLYGMGIFSKHDFVQLDTFMYDNIPNLIGSLRKKNDEKVYHFVSSHITPPLNRIGLERMNQHLKVISDKVNGINEPVLAIGNFNTVAWSNELQSFKKETHMVESRRGGLGPFPTASSMLQTPMKFIFHTEELNCVSFGNINNQDAQEVGIFGIYQLSKNKRT